MVCRLLSNKQKWQLNKQLWLNTFTTCASQNGQKVDGCFLKPKGSTRLREEFLHFVFAPLSGDYRDKYISCASCLFVLWNFEEIDIVMTSMYYNYR